MPTLISKCCGAEVTRAPYFKNSFYCEKCEKVCVTTSTPPEATKEEWDGEVSCKYFAMDFFQSLVGTDPEYRFNALCSLIARKESEAYKHGRESVKGECEGCKMQAEEFAKDLEAEAYKRGREETLNIIKTIKIHCDDNCMGECEDFEEKTGEVCQGKSNCQCHSISLKELLLALKN